MSSIKRHEFPDYIVSRVRRLKQQVVAESGNPDDEYHLGKMLLASMQNNPGSINQIDGNTGETETNGSVARRSQQLAHALRTWGLQQDDVIALMAPLHLNAFMPAYAGFYLGVPVQPVDSGLKLQELMAVLNIGKAKVIFCQSEKVIDIRQALKAIDRQTTIITFNTRHSEADFTYDDFVETYGKGYESFWLAPEREDNLALVIPTSGSTGVPKGVMISQRNFVAQFELLGSQFNVNLDTEVDGAILMNLSGIHWITSFLQFLGCLIYNIPRLNSSAELTPGHTLDLINRYKPAFTFMSPNLASLLLKHPNRVNCDFSCFKCLNLGGNVVSAQVTSSLQNLVTKGKVCDFYGVSEAGYLFAPTTKTESSAIGRANVLFEYRFVDPVTGADVGPYKTGELWVKGGSIVKGYYKDPIGTQESFSDGWLKTGDLVTYNDDGEIFYVDRLKMLIKYKNYQLSPVELENVIRTHPSVEEVVVVGVKKGEVGELPTACVVVKPKCEPNAREIMELVKNKLNDYKHLRGGVAFLKSLPLSSNGKLDRKQVKQLVLSNTLQIIKE